MTDREMLELILEKVSSLDHKVASMDGRVESIDSRVESVENGVTDVKLSLENETNKNIQLLAENHSNLIDKLNQAIKVSDKTTLYEIQVNILKNKVEQLEKEVADIKSQLA